MTTLRFKANKKQKLAFKYLFDSVTTEIWYGGWAWWGKSYVWVSWIWMMCNKYPWVRYAFWRKELKRLKQTTLSSYFKFLWDYNIPEEQCWNFNSQDSIIKFKNWSEILLLDLSYMPSDPLYTRLGSLELTWAFVDESAEIDEKAIIILSTRIWRHNNEKYKIIPKLLEWFNPDKWAVFRKFFKPYSEWTLPFYRQFIPALATDNEFIPKSYIEQLEKADEITKQRLLYGNFLYDDTPWRLFDYDKILDLFKPKSPFTTKRYISCDVARQGKDKCVIFVWEGFNVIDYTIFDTSTIPEIIQEIRYYQEKYWVDNQRTIVDEDWVWWWVVDWLWCIGFVNNSTPVSPYWAKQSTFLKRNYANLKTQCYFELARVVNDNIMSIDCEIDVKNSIIEELDIIVQVNLDDDQKIKIISKEEMKEKLWRSPDFWDCLLEWTKILTVKWEKEIQDINIWDVVITPFWCRRVTNKYSRYEHGNIYSLWWKIFATWNHKIYTDKWFKKIDTMTIKDILEEYNLLNLLKWRLKRLFYIMERNIGFREQVSIITETNLSEVKDLRKHYTETYGKKGIEKFKNDTTYTILMEIVSIIKLKILNQYYDENISQYIWRKKWKMMNFIKKYVKVYERIVKKRKNGIEVKSELSGIKKIINLHYERFDIKNLSVIFAELYIYLKQVLQNSAVINVIKNLIIKQKNITSQDYVSYVEKNFQLEKMKNQWHVAQYVVQKKDGIKVYDLEIEWDNCYYANWILVSNCLMMRCYFNLVFEWVEEEPEHPKYKDKEFDLWNWRKATWKELMWEDVSEDNEDSIF